jgi:hypothetical protein
MSYDFSLARPKHEKVSDELPTCDSRGLPTTPKDPAKEAFKQQLVAVLVKFDPELVPANVDFQAVAEHFKLTEEEARIKFRHIELNDTSLQNTGIQITIRDDYVYLTVPFWHTGQKAERVFRKIWRYMEVISAATGYIPYDEQVQPGELNLKTDFQRSLKMYVGGVSYTRGAVWKILLKYGWRLLFSRKPK